MSEVKKSSLNFIEQIVADDIANGKHEGRIHTRFPPEPNGYLHIGHAKALWVNFNIAQKYGGKTNLRFDDTNPSTEETEFVESIQNDIKWLGYQWDGEPLFASDYFQQLYEYAVKLIKNGDAYVDDSTAEQIAEMKGTPTEPGVNSPYRDRSPEENLKLFEGMKNGDYPDGSRVLRAKVSMSANNMLMRDPVLYRIKHEHHHRTGDEWCIYPLYDFAHGQSDSIERITHSLCSLEFRHHRDLYNWLIKKLEIFPSRQIEFARMNVGYMITSKRKLKKLIDDNLVSGWDDPRMPTLAGMRRRGYPPAGIRNFCAGTGLAKRDNIQEISKLEFCIREELNKTAYRVMGVLDPLKLVITNYPEGQVEEMTVENNPEDETQGTRTMPFSGELYIERSDFMEEAPSKKYFRLALGRNVRLKGGYIIHCDGYTKDVDTGEILEVRCSYYPESRSGSDTSGVKAKGTLHWVSVAQAVEAEVHVYDRLFTDESPTTHEDKDFLEFYNKDSKKVIEKAYLEPSLKEAVMDRSYQFMRLGYFTLDETSTPEHQIFNRTVTLKDSWGKKQKK